jgi:hypothetical protein
LSELNLFQGTFEKCSAFKVDFVSLLAKQNGCDAKAEGVVVSEGEKKVFCKSHQAISGEMQC